MNATQTVEIRRLPAHEAGDAVDTVFAGMSEESRRLRFHLPMNRMPASIRGELIRIDGCARAAVVARADGRPVGIARIAAVSAVEAELAVAVVDQWQGRGVGSRLLHEAVNRAAGLGYRHVVAEVLAENLAMLAVLDRAFPDAVRERHGAVVRVVVALGTDSADDVEASIEPALAAAS
jgi:GNAT superfamily N-acetyltransferase